MQKLIVILLGMALLGAITFGEIRRAWEAPLPLPEHGFGLTVASGDSLRSVVEQLHQAGILAHPQLLIAYGRWTGLDQQIKHGEYLLQRPTTAESLLLMLQRGEVIDYQVTLPEGISLEMAMDILASQETLKVVLSGPNDPALLDLVKPHSHTEGLFFPDTYRYVNGDTDLSILRRARTAMAKVLQEEWLEKSEPLPYANSYEALIMASIIERETGVPEERKQISGVFVRRLQQGMLLQTDPTVIYGLGASFNGNLQRNHLKEDGNVYNTYRHPGLPPTPIALPGREAIHAALHPDTGETLYFVAKGDGAHQFSSTLVEHNKAVKEFQIRRKENYHSQPLPTKKNE